MNASEPISRLNAALEGRYRVERQLGEGGMATVYLADDLKHDRKVALKVLKPELAAVVGAERFLGEIKTTANLQHPHILPLFDSGEADSLLFYVMPYVEEESLRARLHRERQLPVDDAVRIATDMAEALDYAHRQRVIHRDIKPANVLLLDGKPVISDFGIALAVGAAGGGRLTETGLSLGTPHYMSPEQATGDEIVGPATDIYALGCVLYEMLVGEPPFTGSTAQAVLGRIIAGGPASATEQRAAVPANVDSAIRKALEKVPADRFGEARHFAAALGDPGFRHGGGVPAATRPGLFRYMTIGLTATTALLGASLVWLLLRPPAATPVERFTLDVEVEVRSPPALSPDGSAMAFPRTAEGDRFQLWLRRWVDLEPSPIPGTEASLPPLLPLLTPSFSPSGDALAFVADGQLKVTNLADGGVRILAESAYCCPHWEQDGYVYFSGAGGSIDRVPARGGEAVESVTTLEPGEGLHLDFDLVPGTDIGVFSALSSSGPGISSPPRVVAIRLDAGERRTVTDGLRPRVIATDQLVFASLTGEILAAGFDAEAMALTGAPTALIAGVEITAFPNPVYGLSESGSLVYQEDRTSRSEMELVWVTRDGVASPLGPDWVFDLRDPPIPGWNLSPDDTRLAIGRRIEGGADIWVMDLPDGARIRVTDGPEEEALPRWRPGRDAVTFRRAGSDSLWQAPADGSGAVEALLDVGRQPVIGAWSPAGDWLAIRVSGAVGSLGSRDILAHRIGDQGAPTPLLASEVYLEQAPAISPNGRWLAYTSNQNGASEVFVRSFPGAEARSRQVSTEGGIRPLWANGGRELYFVDPRTRRLLAADFDPESGEFGRGRPLFTIPAGYLIQPNTDFYDITSDDQRFLMARPDPARLVEADLVLVQNWVEELRRLTAN